jgi:hypothetical protein
MEQVGTIAFALIFLLAPVGLIVTIILWRKEIKARRAAEQALVDAESELNTRMDAARAEATAEIDKVKARFADVIDLDAEKEKALQELEEIGRKSSALKSEYIEKKAIYDRLTSEIAIFDDRLAFAEMGVYEARFDYGDSDAFKAATTDCRERQKTLVTDKTAVFCTTKWTVDGSQSKGQAMTNRNIKLSLRAFNNECDAAIANSRWNNVNAMEKRIIRAFEQIDKLNSSNSIVIGHEFLKFKLEELYLTHEYREKQKIERDERAEAVRLAREEQRLLRDMEEAQAQEDHYVRMLEKAKAEAATIIGPKLDAFTAQIEMLEKDLADAHAKVERAQAMAERTRSGYVYIISNIGSFGEGIVKIGLTRRLDPMDRVRELGDASVPFTFDIHAVIYSDDAPALERALHGEFESTRINTQNFRKEFFRAALEDVELAVQRLAPNASFFRDVEAQEYRETLSKRNQMLHDPKTAYESFPAAL